MAELVPLIVTVAAFCCVVAIVFVLGRYLSDRATVNRRLPIHAAAEYSAHEIERAGFFDAVANRLDESRFGMTGALRAKIRKDLIRAGYFSKNAVQAYLLIRLVLLLVVPIIAVVYARIFFGDWPPWVYFLLVAIAVMIAFLGPDAYISRRQAAMQFQYRIQFPDLIDLLVVCCDAGLALDGALNRVRTETYKRHRALGTNLMILGAETRAGRSLSDALGGFADRLNLDEARALVVMLRQSLELGTDLADALRVFSDEMRIRRLLRAEENANKLPVKITFPLGLFIFPVILMVVLVPVVIRLFSVLYGI